MGRDIALGFIPVTGSGEGMSVSGFASLPTCCRGSRGYQHFFVNGRYVKSRVMMAALEEAYKNQRMVGRFPGCVLHLTVKPNEVDVNVHPTKTEVKFRSEQQVFATVYHGVLSALSGDRSRPQAVIPGVRREDTVTPNQTAFSLRDVTAPEVPKKPLAVSAPPLREPAAEPRPVFRRAAVLPREEPEHIDRPAREEKPVAPAPKQEPVFDRPVSRPAEPVRTPAPPPKPAPEPAPPVPEEEPWRVKGELFNTYVIVEQGDKALLIDKHAAHERANFDRLKAADYQPMVQELLAPVTFAPAPEERAVLVGQLELLARFGFEVEEFGTAALAVRAAPDYLDAGDIEPALLELARRIRVTGSADPAAARDELLHTMACKAAIKGGQRNGPAELEEVARMVMSGAVKYCPHGRPVAIEPTRNQLEKQFKRS